MADFEHTAVSLFSGIGGFETALHDEGFDPLFCSELDPNARATLTKWLQSKEVEPIVAPDVTEVDPCSLGEDLGLQGNGLDLLVGGPPCQSFSLIGKRASLEDARGLLILQMIRFADALRPKAVIVEQVKGLKSASGPEGEKGGALELVLSEFRRVGYETAWKVLRAADYGVPQKRDRLFIVATRDGEFTFPRRTHAPPKTAHEANKDLFEEPLKEYRTVGDAIADLPPPVEPDEDPPLPNHIDITPDRDRKKIRDVPEGDYLARQTHISKELRGNLNPKKDTTKFRRMSWDEPSLTIRGGEAFYHPEQDRYLTPRECMRLHGFPDDHVLVGPIRGRSGSVRDLDQHRLVGNAVPPQLPRSLIQALKEQGFLS